MSSRADSTEGATGVGANPPSGTNDPAPSPSLSRTSQLSLVSEPHNTRRQLINSLEQHWPQQGEGEDVALAKNASMSPPNGSSSPPVSQWASLYPVNGGPAAAATGAAVVVPANNNHNTRPTTTTGAANGSGVNGVNTNGLGVSVQLLSSPSIQPPTASSVSASFTPLPPVSATATPAAVSTPAVGAIGQANGATFSPASPSPVPHSTIPPPGSVPSPNGFANEAEGAGVGAGVRQQPSSAAPVAARLQSSHSAAAVLSVSPTNVIQVPPLPPYEPDSNFESSHRLPSTQHTRRPSPIPPINANLAPYNAAPVPTMYASTAPSRSPNRSPQPPAVFQQAYGHITPQQLIAAAAAHQRSSSPPAASSALSLRDVRPVFSHKKAVFSICSPQVHFSWLHEPESNVWNVDEDEDEETLHRKDEEKQKLLNSQSSTSSQKPHQSAAARLASKIRSSIVTKQHAQNSLLHGGIYVYNVHEKMAAESLVSNKNHTEIKHLCSVYSTKFLGTRPVEIDAQSFAELQAHAAGGDRKILLAAAAGNSTPADRTSMAPMQVESNASKAWGDLRKQLAAQRAERRRQEEEEASKGNCCSVFWKMLC